VDEANRSERDYGRLWCAAGCRCLLHDRDTKLTRSFRAIIASVKEDCLSKVILFGGRSLRRALSNYVDHFHAERNHQGKGNVLLFPRVNDRQREGPVRCRERLAGSCAITIERRRVMSGSRFSFLTVRGLPDAKIGINR
jgi:hypothetical protein